MHGCPSIEVWPTTPLDAWIDGCLTIIILKKIILAYAAVTATYDYDFIIVIIMFSNTTHRHILLCLTDINDESFIVQTCLEHFLALVGTHTSTSNTALEVSWLASQSELVPAELCLVNLKIVSLMQILLAKPPIEMTSSQRSFLF